MGGFGLTRARWMKTRTTCQTLPDLKYALETLLDNSNDFAASQIDITIGWSKQAIEIEITDDGPGFTSAVLSRLGQPWNSSREGSDGHKGLGLFLAMTLIEGLVAR